jgi:ligand-binding sensor domain-containing protein
MVRRALPLAAALLSLASMPASAQRFTWRAGDRVLVGALGELGAVAVSPRHVYAAGPAGVVVYDLVRDTWAPPLPLTDETPLGEQPTALAYDRVLDALWLGTAAGALHSYTLGFDRWERVGTVTPGPVLFLAVSADGLFIAGRDGWQRLARGSFIAYRIGEADVPPEVRARAAERFEGRGRDPSLDAARATLGLDPALRRWPITDDAPGDRPGETWLATGGGGLLRYDARRMRADWLPIGLPARGAAAVTAHGSDVWLGGAGAGGSGGVARTSTALDRWAVHHADAGAPGGLVRELLPVGGGLWVAADDGLYHLDVVAADADASRRTVWRRITAADGLPDDRVSSIAAAEGGFWVATMRGITFVDAAGDVAPLTIAPGRAFARVALIGDTLWAAGEDGVWVVPRARTSSILPGALVNVPQARVPGAFLAPGTAGHAALRGPVLDLTADAHRVVALTATGTFTHVRGTWSGPDRAAEQAGVGRPVRVRLQEGRLWVAGERGAAVHDTATGAWTRYLVPADIPAGPVLDVAAAGEHVWLATPLGALRLRVGR